MPASGGGEKRVLVTACSAPMQTILRHSLEKYRATMLYVDADPMLDERMEAESPHLVLASIDPFMESAMPSLGALAAAASRLSIPVIAYSEKWRAEDMAAKTRPHFDSVLWAPLAMQQLHDLMAEYLA